MELVIHTKTPLSLMTKHSFKSGTAVLVFYTLLHTEREIVFNAWELLVANSLGERVLMPLNVVIK